MPSDELEAFAVAQSLSVIVVRKEGKVFT